MYELVASARRSDDMSNGFHRDRGRRRNELTDNKNQKGKYHPKLYLKYVFRFAEHQEKSIFGPRYKLVFIRKNDNCVLTRDDATIIGKIKINGLEW